MRDTETHSLADIGKRPPHVNSDKHFGSWFVEIAERLLNATDFIVNGIAYHIAELEAYYHGPGHIDPFSHREPVQLENGRWYFHRTGDAYRGGSFKGLDFTFGDGTAFFGVLIRTIIAPDGTLIDGPCLTVDHLLAQTKIQSVPALDALIGSRKVWDHTSPLHIVEAKPQRTATIYRTSRLGLSLKRAKGKPDAPKFIGRQYRFLTEPKMIAKGKMQLVLSLHQQGETVEAIHRLTSRPMKAVRRYIAEFECGKRATNFESYAGRDLSAAELCRLLGMCAVR